MTLLPEQTVHAYVAAEMAAAQAWAARQGYKLDYDQAAVALTLQLSGPSATSTAAEEYLVKGTFEDYRALPPRWWFAHPDTGADIGPAAYPQPPAPHPRGSALVTTGPSGVVICADFNRLAYSETAPDGQQRAGIHPNWGQPANWLNLPSDQYTRAETIGDMLARIALEIADSNGRMAPLP